MKTMRRTIILASALFVCATSFGQNLNPTVEVTNIYQGNASEIHKPQTGMAIPDSLLRFDMDFDYEVFQKPYQGAYNFKPYMLAMKPDKDAYRGKKLYLRAGAGYSLHPQLDFVFSPEQKGPFQMSVYANNRSYFGDYYSLSSSRSSDGYRLERTAKESFFGYDALSSIGFDGRYNLPGTTISFGAGYKGLMTQDTLANRAFNAMVFNARIRSNKDEEKYVFYDVAVDGSLGGLNTGSAKLGENIIRLTGNAGPVLSRTQKVLVGFEAESVAYSNMYKYNAGRLAFIPKYLLKTGQWDLSIGVRLEKLLGGTDLVWDGPANTYRGNWLFPDVHVSYAVSNDVRLFASATGGNDLNPVSSLLDRNHFWRTSYHSMDNSVENVNARVGIKGIVNRVFQYEIRGGAAVYANGLVESPVSAWPADGIYFYLPTSTYQDYSLIYGDALFGLTYSNLKVDAGLHFRNMAFKEENAEGLLVPKFSFDMKTIYDINSRAYVGIRVNAVSSRKGLYSNPFIPYAESALSLQQTYNLTVPGYFDLGLLAGYQFNRKLGFWLESGNLLCETVQRNLFYAEKGLWITAGITLSL